MDNGLEGVVAAETVLSHTDGERGVVLVRGHTVQDLIAHHGYDGAVALLWDGFAGEGLTRAGILAALGEGRQHAFARIDGWLDAAARRPLLEGVRMCLAAMPDDSAPAQIAGGLAVGIAALIRARQGQPPLAPNPDFGTAADLLRMVHGAPVDRLLSDALDA